MNKLQNDYTNNPVDYLISQRIDQLCITYSKAQLRAAVYLLNAGLESNQHIIVLHLNNVINTYGFEALSSVLSLYNINDSNLDFNVDDKAG